MKTPEQYADQINKENRLTATWENYSCVDPKQLTGPLLDAYKAGMTEAAQMVDQTEVKADPGGFYTSANDRLYLARTAILAARDAKTSL
jgi:hypothetical protein